MESSNELVLLSLSEFVFLVTFASECTGISELPNSVSFCVRGKERKRKMGRKCFFSVQLDPVNFLKASPAYAKLEALSSFLFFFPVRCFREKKRNHF